MLKYLAKRIGRSLLTLFLVVTIVFCLLRLMPKEGYFANYEKLTDAQIQAGLQAMGLLDPLPLQILNFWKNLLTQGDLGVSHIYKVNASVTSILAKKLPISVEMGVLAMCLALVVGLQGRFAEADQIARRELSPQQAEANVAYLRGMLAQQNSWAKLAAKDGKAIENGTN